MNTNDIESIWSQQDESTEFEDILTLEEVRETTVAFTSDRVSSGQRTIRFDTIYKGLVLAGNILLISMGAFTVLRLSVSVLIVACLAYLMKRNRVLDRGFELIDEAYSVIDVLQQRYAMLNRFYREFLISSSVTHALFVFTGFQFYHFFRYGEGQFDHIISDPVIYAFLGLAFIIPFMAQRITYSRLIGEMKQILALEVNEVEQELKAIEIQSRNQARKVIYTTIALLGIALLIILIIRIS